MCPLTPLQKNTHTSKHLLQEHETNPFTGLITEPHNQACKVTLNRIGEMPLNKGLNENNLTNGPGTEVWGGSGAIHGAASRPNTKKPLLFPSVKGKALLFPSSWSPVEQEAFILHSLFPPVRGAPAAVSS